MAPCMQNNMVSPVTTTFLLLAGIFLITHAAKLNAPKVLLPYYSSVVVNFTLQVEYSPEEAQVANCFQWLSSRPEVAQVHLINSTDGTCAQTAVVSAVSKTSHQMTTVILAENKVTGEILRSNLIVGEIVHLEIETTTKLLFLDDSPEELIVRGFDSEGNIFSNLEGLSFEWNLTVDKETKHNIYEAHNILRIKRFADSQYTTPHHIAPLEDRGIQGDTILVEGISTGIAKISARIKDPVYKNLKPNEVRIMVVANLMLLPQDSYVLVHDRVKYKVELLRHNSIKQIEMPSNQYYLEVKDTDICQLEVQTSMVTASALGSTEVVLKDRNIIGSEDFPRPSAMIHVVTPNFLVFVVLPHRKWVLEAGKEYEIYIEIYDSDNHKMYPSDNVRVLADFPEQYLKVLYSSVNGTYHRVRALLKGETFIDGALTSIVDDRGNEHAIVPTVKRRQDLEIFDPVRVTPVKVVFPWDPVTRCIHRYTVQAKGGSGEYLWSVTEADVATVAVKGQITTVGPGKCNVTASDVKNAALFGVSTVHVLPPTDMAFPPSVVEAVVGTKLILPLSVSANIDGKLEAFTDCRLLSVNVTLTDTSVFEYIPADQNVTPTIPDNGCMSLTFLAKHQGHAEVTAAYRSKNVVLRATLTIAAFNPLKAIDPEEQAVVAIGSSREIVFLGGPQPWVLDSSKFFLDLDIPTKNQKVKAERLTPVSTSRGAHSFILTCLDLGDQEVQLTVGNGKTAKNTFPISQTTSIRFACAEAVELHLVPAMRSKPHLPPCPIHYENNNPIPVHFGTDLDIVVIVTDSMGRRLDNFSSMAVDWSVSAPHLAELLHTKDLKTEVDTPDRTTATALQTLRPHRKTGSVVVTASIDHYKSWTSKIVARQKDKISPAISKSLELLLVEDAVLSPSSVSVFNHPSNKVSIGIQYGSGYFYLDDQHSLVLTARYNSKDRAVEVTPLKDGTHSFTVYDLCIDAPSYPVATISVSGVSSVQVMVIDKVQVMKEVTAGVQVLDLKGKPLLASFFSLMELRLEAASDIVTLRPANRSADDSVTRLYTVHGEVVGHTSLMATIRLPTGQVIYSSPKPVEVFPPLRLDPKNITLIIGAVFQVLAFGGPQTQSNVEFFIVSSNVATVSGAGVLDALEIGTTRVVGKSVGTDSVTGEKVVYSQDDALVNVVTLRGIRIQTALTRMQTGTQMPVYAVGLTEHETPFSFGHSVLPMTFTWSVNNREVLRLQSIYHKSGIIPSLEASFTQQAVAKQSGHVTIKLKVETRAKSRLQIHGGLLQDEVQIHVFEKLSLLTPAICHGQIRITPNTDTPLKTNRDSAARVRYVVVDSKPEAPVVRLLDNGQLRSGPIPGSAILHVTAEEEFGLNQTLVILVLVKPVSYLMINSDTVIQTSTLSQLSTVPIGAVLQFHVSYHDDVGDEFYATNIQLGVRCSRYDLVQVSVGSDNNTLLVRAAEAGTTVLKVWDKSRPTVADYVNIPVGSAIQPAQATVTLGSVVCFNSPIIAEKGTWGWWKSKSDFLYVDERSGIAVGTGVGRTAVVYAFSPLISTKTEVTIEPIKAVSVGQGIGFLTNSLSKGKSLFFPVSFSDGENIVGPNCSSVIIEAAFSPSFIPYNCLLEMTQADLDVTTGDLFTVLAHFDKDKGIHGCLVIQNPSSHTSQLISTLDTSLVLSARVPPSMGQAEVVSNLLNLDLLPAFHVHNAEIHLTTLSPLSSIRVSSSAKVISDIQVVVSDPNLIQVLSPERDSNSNNVILFPVRLLDSLTLWEREHLDLAVEVVHAKIGHTVQVPVVAKLIGQKPDIPHLSNYRQDLSWSSIMRTVVSNYQSWLIICFILILIAAAMLFGYHAIFGPKYKTTSSPNVFLNTSGMQPSPSSSFIQQSPPAGSASFTSPRRPSPITSPKLWSVSYNQDLRSSPHKRNTYSFTKS